MKFIKKWLKQRREDQELELALDRALINPLLIAGAYIDQRLTEMAVEGSERMLDWRRRLGHRE